jgi:CheY-like chemotaxis protein
LDEPVRIGGEGPQPEAMRPGPIVPRRRVLVVDDDDASAQGLAMILRFDGYEVRVARDAESALRVVRAFRPEAILSDIGLPEIDGHELARRIRQDRDLSASLKLLAAVTGQGEPEVRRRSREAGFDRHLVKPIDPEVILALLASLEWREEPLVLEPS